MPASSIARAISSVICVLRSMSSAPSLLAGSLSAAADRRPTSRRWKAPRSLLVISFDSDRVIQEPSWVPQSSSRVITSCATSTRRRVR